ncbi:hypothetical protein P3L10_033525 [Capsicum annuum]
MDEIEKVNKFTVEYLKEEEPERWACSFHTNRWYNMVMTNNVESMNVVLRKSRKPSILGLADYIQNKLQRWFYERKIKAQGNFHDITRWAVVEVTGKIQAALKLKVNLIDVTRFVVREEKVECIVDLKNRTCQCLVFQTDEGEILPVGSTTSWIVPDSIKDLIIKLPDTKVLLGRRQTTRYPCRIESSRNNYRCSRCKRTGHDISNCHYTPIFIHMQDDTERKIKKHVVILFIREVGSK